MNVRCPECGSENIMRDVNGEMVCANCGLVIEEGFVSGNTLI